MLPETLLLSRRRRALVVRRVSVLVVLTLVSGLSTARIAGAGADRPVADAPLAHPLPVAPAETDLPVSVTAGRRVQTRTSLAAHAVTSASTSAAIPGVALAAYQRAEAVMRSADASCHLPWTLVAAIGRVESNHGRFDGSSLAPDGVSQPGIVGMRLDGTRGTERVSDTDAGRLDGDPVFDRAVGPMQFIPATWSVVAVDADGDDKRDPQDIDDAALAAAVYLCSGAEDLRTARGARRAVLRYNHSDAYVDLVLSVQDAYANAPTVTGDIVAAPVVVPITSSAAQVAPQEQPEQPTDENLVPPDAGGAAGPGNQPGPAGPGGGHDDPSGAGPDDPEPDAPLTRVVEAVTRAQASLSCRLAGLVRILRPAAFEACVRSALD